MISTGKIWKIAVAIVIIIPLFIDLGCRKQAKCGCDGDMLFELDKEPASVYFTQTNAYFSPNLNPYSTYYFCNPEEMYPKMSEFKSGDLLLVSGRVFWECNYLYSSSNYSYQTYYNVYMIYVTDITSDLYGKK